MLPNLVQRCAAVTAGRTHFVEAVDEQCLAGKLWARFEGGKGACPEIVAAGSRRLALKRSGLAGTGVAQQHVGRHGAKSLQRLAIACASLLVARRAGTRHQQVGIDELAQNQCSAG
ncbi:hypothetical protein [Accumulibacter sp.]|uniref:hypothetical protein n=1 Tax=Accumulibacter sp. TaxID=2053492 RepID=UPI001AD30FD6|nr:hypothetical protein [Accumulibacter sp.]MBN8455868.1 hypothetical protein [Accumulibacter sp.]